MKWALTKTVRYTVDQGNSANPEYFYATKITETWFLGFLIRRAVEVVT